MKKFNSFSILDNYSIYSKSQDSNDILLQNKKSTELVLMKQIIVSGMQNLSNMIETLSIQKTIDSPYILSLIDYHLSQTIPTRVHTFEKYQILALYEQASHSLQEQIQIRKYSNTHFFAQSQIWNILFCLIKALSCLQKQNIGHGCITTNDIYLTADSNIKIIDPTLSSSSPYQYTNGYYYSPEMIKKFIEDSPDLISQPEQFEDKQINLYKCDVFSLGMCLLECALLSSCQQCYDYQNFRINAVTLKQKFNSLVEYYSEDFLDLVYRMISFDVDKRPDFKQLQVYMQKMFPNLNKKLECYQYPQNYQQMTDQCIKSSTMDAEDYFNIQFIIDEQLEKELPDIHDQQNKSSEQQIIPMKNSVVYNLDFESFQNSNFLDQRIYQDKLKCLQYCQNIHHLKQNCNHQNTTNNQLQISRAKKIYIDLQKQNIYSDKIQNSQNFSSITQHRKWGQNVFIHTQEDKFYQNKKYNSIQKTFNKSSQNSLKCQQRIQVNKDNQSKQKRSINLRI